MNAPCIISAGKNDTKSMHYFRREANFAFWTLAAQRKGSFTLRHKSGPEFRYDETDFCLVEPNTPYEAFSEKPTRGGLWICFTPSSSLRPLLNWPMEDRGRHHLRVSVRTWWKKIYETMESVVEHATSHDVAQEALAINSLERVFLLAHPLLKSVAQEPSILKVMETIRQNPARQWTIKALAKTVNMSETALSHRFSKVMGMPPIHYADLQRMEYAKTLLLRTNDSITAISEQLGYANPYHFSNRFQKITDQRPLAFRKKPDAIPPQPARQA